MLILFLGSILVGVSTFFLIILLFENRGFVDFILSWFTLYLAQIIIVELFLGTIGKLYLLNIFFLHICILLIAFLMYHRTEFSPLSRPDIAFILNNKILLFAIAIFLGFFSVKAWIKLINPPVFPDALQYHLSFPATWIRNGNIINPLVIFGHKGYPETLTALTYYPMSAELYFYWLMAPLRNAFLADVGQVPFYLIGILAIYSILRKFSVKKDTALFLSFVWALIPNLFKQIKNGAQVDVMCAAIFLVVLNYILIIKENPKLKNFILFGISLGIFISTKAINIFWALSLLPLFLYLFFVKVTKNKLGVITIILFSALLIGGYSYINNFILTGNIFYPITFKLFGKTIMPGTIDRGTFAYLLYPWEEFRIRDVLFSEGLGLQLLAFVIPGVFIPLTLVPFFRKKFNSTNFITYLLIFLIPLIMLLEYFFYIKAFWIRYFFPFLGAGLVCFIIFLDKFSWGKKYITIIGALCIITSMAELAKRSELIISLILSVMLFTLLIKSRTFFTRSYQKLVNPRFLSIFTIFLFIFLIFLNGKYNNEEADRYPLLFRGKEASERDVGLAWQWIHKNTFGGKRIAYTGRGEFYPLFGRNLVNGVFYVSVNDKPPLAHCYPDGQYRKEQNEKAWLANLRKNKVELLVVFLPHDDNKFPIEDEWVGSHPDVFRLVFSNSKAHIYKVLF